MNTESFPSRPVALITGASRGIGAAIAESFASAGYDLILTCSRTPKELESVAANLTQRFSVPCRTSITDMRSSADVRALFRDIHRLDVLVNNAGISYVGLLHEMSDEAWDSILSTNLSSVFYTCRESIPLMLRNHSGRIINISSVWGTVGASTEVAYSASKGGMNSLTKALAKELAPSGIPVNAICCGVIDTSMNACFTQEDLEALRNEIPADRIGSPAEVARLALQLAEAPTYLTGQLITLDGGWY